METVTRSVLELKIRATAQLSSFVKMNELVGDAVDSCTSNVDAEQNKHSEFSETHRLISHLNVANEQFPTLALILLKYRFVINSQ